MHAYLPYHQPATHVWETEASRAACVQVLVRREDQNHPFVSGNKWWKLKYNLLHAMAQQQKTIVTFGGAYSNHIYATAAACRDLQLQAVGIIRGEETRPLNSTLAFAEACGMRLHFISRAAYRTKSEPEFLDSLQQKFRSCAIIPEGGTNSLAIRGSEELGHALLDTPFDYCCLAVGTGGTLAGIINAVAGKRKIIGVPVLKDGGFLYDAINPYVEKQFMHAQLVLDYHFGGYAKTTAALNAFIQTTLQQGIETEFVYTGKLFYAVQDLLQQGFFVRGSTVLVLHSGGLRPISNNGQ
jgi:1-aminocyclopropane-1-carboxylate deaminase